MAAASALWGMAEILGDVPGSYLFVVLRAPQRLITIGSIFTAGIRRAVK